MTWRRPLASLAVASGAFLFLSALSLTSVGCGEDDPPADEPVMEAGAPETTTTVRDGTAEARVIGPAVECAIGSAIELEGNDTPATATAFTELSACGVLETAKDVDYFTFDTPPNTTLTVFQAVIDGKVDFELSLGGATFGPGETTKFGSGTYLVKAFTKADKPASYRFRVQFE